MRLLVGPSAVSGFSIKTFKTLLDRVGEVHPAKRRRRCEDDDIARL